MYYSEVFLISIAVTTLALYKCIKKKKQTAGDGPGNQTPRTPLSSKTPLGHDYEVFLNFRGTDTRTGFTDFLYTRLVDAGIWVFRDDNNLPVGEKIGPELLKAIQSSRITIPILSEDYASSKWCLIELVQILECKKMAGQVVLPIFYKVRPADVKNLTGSFGRSFNSHKKKVDAKTLQEWKEALRELTSLKGWESEKIANGHEGELVRLVVTKVLSELKKAFLDVTEYLVGIDDHVEKVKKMLDVNFNDVRFLGIHGVGGVGKTTLAKFIYNELSNHFESCSFLADIRETSSQHEGILYLQKQLISSIIKEEFPKIMNVDEGINVLKSRFREKRVLILLDDVDDSYQLNALARKHDWFGLGSRIIITTRNKEALNVPDVNWTYELAQMEFDDSLTLFSKHAFRRDSPPGDFMAISKDIVFTTDGLPLAIEIISSFLSGKRKVVWEGTLKKLKEIPNHKVRAKLRISYEALEHEQKQIFLDIACLLIGMDKVVAQYMWEDCGFFPDEGIEVLTLMSLVKIGDNNELLMHDQLRDLGREIVREESYDYLGKRSRLWKQEEALEVVERKQGTKKVQALRLDKVERSEYYCFTNEQFQKLTMVRFLQVNYANFVGDFQDLVPKLRWLEWKGCTSNFMATNFNVKNLVILNLSNSEVTDDWGGWSQMEMAKNLKVLNLTGCMHLSTTPNFSAFSRLEILILEKCKNLEEIHPSIGDIKTLITINVNDCEKMEKLPDEVGRMKRLKELRADRSSIREIPVSERCMKKLETLTAVNCQMLAKLPSLLGQLTSLSTLDLTDCTKLEELPESVGKLVKLHTLWLEECKLLKKIPESIGNLELLTELNVSFTGIRVLPDSIGNLRNLKVLRMVNSRITSLPSSIGVLGKLEMIDATCCDDLQGVLPYGIGNLSSLQSLLLGSTKISGLPNNIHKLSALRKLDLCNCEKLESVPELPLGLTSLELNCTSMTDFPSTSNLTNLRHLAFSDFSNVENRLLYIGKLDKLETLNISDSDVVIKNLAILSRLKSISLINVGISDLPTDISALTQLREVSIDCCEKLENLPQLPSSLTKLYIGNSPMLKGLPDLSNLQCLSKLTLQECSELTEINGLEGLDSLMELEAYECRQLSNLNGLEVVESLNYLRLRELAALERLPDLSNLKNLIVLLVMECENIVELRGFDNMESLEHLIICECSSIERLDDLSYLKVLKDLNVNNCKKLHYVEGLDELTSLKKLNISGCTSMVNFSDLSKLKNLEELYVKDFIDLLEIPGLEEMKSLNYLDISGCKSIKRLPDMCVFSNLEYLIATDCEKLIEIQGLQSLKFLKYLDISGCTSLKRMPDLPIGVHVECDVRFPKKRRKNKRKPL